MALVWMELESDFSPTMDPNRWATLVTNGGLMNLIQPSQSPLPTRIPQPKYMYNS